jgi:hypothetical protein
MPLVNPQDSFEAVDEIEVGIGAYHGLRPSDDRKIN